MICLLLFFRKAVILEFNFSIKISGLCAGDLYVFPMIMFLFLGPVSISMNQNSPFSESSVSLMSVRMLMAVSVNLVLLT